MPAATTARWAMDLAWNAVGRVRRRGEPRTFYEVLGLPPGADEAQIKAAYRDLARRHHPDVNGGDAAATRQLTEINHAYETLSDPRARSAYDHALAWQQAQMRRHWSLLAATTAVTFVLTLAAVSYLVRWHLHAAPPVASVVAAPAGDGPGRGAQGPMPATVPAVSVEPGVPPQISDPALWSTFRNPRFDFTLRYPAGLLVHDPAQSDGNVHTFVSRDRRATFRIVASDNTAGISLVRFRSVLIKQRYGGAAFEQTPQRRHWFALAGTQAEEVFLERITFSCDGKAMYGWQMRYPKSQRAIYDEVAKQVLLNPPHGNEPGAGCEEEKPKPRAKRRRD
jgi:hypothetical protein